MISLINGRNFVSRVARSARFAWFISGVGGRKASMINSRSIQEALRCELRRITRAGEKSFARAPGEEGERHCHRARSRTFITLRIRDSARRTLAAGLAREISPRSDDSRNRCRRECAPRFASSRSLIYVWRAFTYYSYCNIYTVVIM